MEQITQVINEVTTRTFKILKSIYDGRKEGQPASTEDLGSRIIFPHYRDGEIRLSEQELRFVFVEQFNKYCQEKSLPYYYSVETPTELKYYFKDKNEPRIDDENGQSAMIDLAIHDNNLVRIALIEFKALNPDSFCYKKDFCKLKEEADVLNKLATFFIMFVKSSDSRTKNNIATKISSKSARTCFRCYDLTHGEEIKP